MNEAGSPEGEGHGGAMSVERVRKFRQAAFVYLHVGILYEATVWVVAGRGLLSPARGPLWLWLVFGAAIVTVVFWALWFKRSVWVARIVWGVHALRVVPLVEGAFLPGEARQLPPSFYLSALVVVLVNLWMLARAGWDL